MVEMGADRTYSYDGSGTSICQNIKEKFLRQGIGALDISRADPLIVT
jgi:hypothetical protein